MPRINTRRRPEPSGNDPVRVVHVLWRLSPGGGVQTVVRNIVTRLDPHRVELHIITVRPRFKEDRLDELPKHVTLHPLGYSGRLRPWHRFMAMVRVAILFARLRPQLAQAHTGTAWLSLFGRVVLPRTPFVLEVHDAPGHGRHSPRTERFEGFLARRAGFTALCHSTSVRRDVARAWRIDEDKTVLFPLGVDTAQFDRPASAGVAWRAAQGLAPERPIVLYVARLVPSKNVDLLVKAADRFRRGPVVPKPRPLFVVVAGGSERDRLSEEIRRQGLADDVVLAGPIYLPELADAYAAADLFCSTSDYEGFGLAVVEAMASGLAVVATAVGGITDLVAQGETGLLVPRGDADAVASAVAKLLAHIELRTAFAASGRLRARERFEISSMVEQFEDLYLTLGRGRPRR